MVGTGRTGGRPELTGAELMIDLGTIRDDLADPEPRRPFTWRRLRPVALAFGAALLLATGGSGLPPEPALTEIAILPNPAAPLNPGPNRRLLLTDERLFTTTVEDGGLTWLVSAYELDRGRRVWTYRFAVSPDTQLELAHRAGLLLLAGPRLDHTGMRTVALDVRTGRERWSLPHQVQAFSGADSALAIDMVFPEEAVTGADGAPEVPDGAAYGSPWGQGYTSPPDGFIATGITLSSGEVRWRSELLTDVVPDGASSPIGAGEPAAGPDASVAVVRTNGEVELWDPGTAAVRHRFPPTYPDSQVQLGDGLLLIQHTEREVTAYSTETYQRRWTRQVGADNFVGFCGYGELVCDSYGSDAEVLDPATGAPAWRITSNHLLGRSGGHLVEFQVDDGLTPLRTVDPRTGEPQLNLSRWRGDTLPTAGGPMLLTAPEAFLGPTWLGVLSPGAAAPVVLGSVPSGVAKCQLTTSVIACATPGNEVRLWRYRTGIQPDHD
jgi:outer membrane protein assembly factor BamB